MAIAKIIGVGVFAAEVSNTIASGGSLVLSPAGWYFVEGVVNCRIQHSPDLGTTWRDDFAGFSVSIGQGGLVWSDAVSVRITNAGAAAATVRTMAVK